jgi:broad specificity phosphatase PhoE
MAALVHLVRHGEVANPDNLVYGSLPGFGLSTLGLEQARKVGRYLGPRPLVAIWSSPLERSLRTAEEIAARSGVPVRVDNDLTEWYLSDRWKGHPWAKLSSTFPGELEAYLDHPQNLAFSPESLDELADRMASVCRKLDSEHPHGDVVLVSHQDPIQAGRLRLIGSSMHNFHAEKPDHGSVLTLRPGDAWKEETIWTPGDTPGFADKAELRAVGSHREPTPPTSA